MFSIILLINIYLIFIIRSIKLKLGMLSPGKYRNLKLEEITEFINY